MFDRGIRAADAGRTPRKAPRASEVEVEEMRRMMGERYDRREETSTDVEKVGDEVLTGLSGPSHR